MKLFEWLIATLALVMSGVFFHVAGSFPRLTADPGGAALFPRIVAIFTGTMAAILIGRLVLEDPTFRTLRQTVGQWRFPRDGNGELFLRSAVGIALSIAYPYFVIKAGFIAASVVFIMLLMTLYRVSLLVSVPFALVIGYAIYFLFNQLLGAYVPEGQWFSR